MSDEHHRASRWRIVVCGAGGGILLLLAGCLVFPANHYQSGSRHNVKPETADILVPGITTKEEVLLKLGEPDFVSEDGQRFGYAWTKVKGIWIVASYGGGGVGEFTHSDVLMASFDCSNRVSQVRLIKEWGPQVTPTRELDTTP